MAFIVDAAKYIPEKKILNCDLVQFPERYRDIIAEKAGIVSRYHVTEECTSDIGSASVRSLLNKIGIDPLQISALICATSSPDRIQPATATRIQEICGLKNAFAFDINSVCSGAIYALRLASSLVQDGLDNIIVVASEVYSKILNPKDITTYPYFGDGAGAVLVSKQGIYEMMDFVLGSDGSGADVIQVPGGGTMLSHTKIQKEKDFYFSMNGSEVYKFACSRGKEVLTSLSEKHGIIPDRVITHQANINIIKQISEQMNWSLEKFYINVDRYANTAGASVLIALSENMAEHISDQTIMLVAFGGGLSWGGVYLKKMSKI